MEWVIEYWSFFDQSWRRFTFHGPSHERTMEECIDYLNKNFVPPLVDYRLRNIKDNTILPGELL